jgi:hypothetical protein
MGSFYNKTRINYNGVRHVGPYYIITINQKTKQNEERNLQAIND